jgi:hypothetical protein
MFPYPTKKYIPKILQENMDNFGQALCDFMDDCILELQEETINLRYFYTVELIPSQFLDIIGNQLQAEIKQVDTNRQKRVKILNAISGRAKRSLWEDDVKIRIDSITGLDAQLFSPFGLDDWILCGDGLTPSAFYWAALGVDGVDDGLGISLIGEGDEVEITGNIYIDLGGSVAASVIDRIIEDIQNIVPAYFRIKLGYVSGTTFIELGEY